jgi:hypothetical protein
VGGEVALQEFINTIGNDFNNTTAAQRDAITPEILNSTITTGKNAGQSIAFVLADNEELGHPLLIANYNRLALNISADTLNAIIQDGPYAGYSVAYLLTKNAYKREILAANDNALASQIRPETLNTIIPGGPEAGRSVALRKR